MHCPSCGHDNPLTTRFCADCGAVLVEDAKRGKARRLLRLRKRPPKPAKPAPEADSSSAPPAHRYGWALAFVLGIAMVGGYLASTTRSTSAIVIPQAVHVPLPVDGDRPAVNTEAESAQGIAGALTDPPPGTEKIVPPREPVPISGSTRKARDAARAAAREPSEPEPPPVETPPPEPPPPPVVVAEPPLDPHRQMMERIARCANASPLDRFVCDQRARLAYCDGRWGQVPDCPSGRTGDYGQ